VGSETVGLPPRIVRPNIIQIVEVTPDRRVVWVLQDRKHPGPATSAQFLDEPGIPEKPGALQALAGLAQLFYLTALGVPTEFFKFLGILIVNSEPAPSWLSNSMEP
jgi:hypothetical protein